MWTYCKMLGTVLAVIACVAIAYAQEQSMTREDKIDAAVQEAIETKRPVRLREEKIIVLPPFGQVIDLSTAGKRNDGR
jgi:hypothetical protein